MTVNGAEAHTDPVGLTIFLTTRVPMVNVLVNAATLSVVPPVTRVKVRLVPVPLMTVWPVRVT